MGLAKGLVEGAGDFGRGDGTSGVAAGEESGRPHGRLSGEDPDAGPVPVSGEGLPDLNLKSREALKFGFLSRPAVENYW
jgi:hypothetical protein